MFGNEELKLAPGTKQNPNKAFFVFIFATLSALFRYEAEDVNEDVNLSLGAIITSSSRQVSNPKAVTLKNGRPATQGACPVCGTKVFRIGKG